VYEGWRHTCSAAATKLFDFEFHFFSLWCSPPPEHTVVLAIVFYCLGHSKMSMVMTMMWKIHQFLSSAKKENWFLVSASRCTLLYCGLKNSRTPEHCCGAPVCRQRCGIGARERAAWAGFAPGAAEVAARPGGRRGLGRSLSVSRDRPPAAARRLEKTRRTNPRREVSFTFAFASSSFWVAVCICSVICYLFNNTLHSLHTYEHLITRTIVKRKAWIWGVARWQEDSGY